MGRWTKWLAAALGSLGAVGTFSSCASSARGFSEPTRPHFTNAAYGRSATLSGPVTTGHIVEPESGRGGGLPAGYVEQEFFAAGRASALRATSTPADGRWTIVPTSSAPYETRIVVRRPADPGRFNGTVVVEWLNVSAGESSPDWDYLEPALSDAGFAYVGVSAQALGVVGGRSLLSAGGSGTSGGLVGAEPARYGSLRHPGDQYSYDIFAQIGRALRTGAAGALGDLRARHIVAVGESQSAFFLTTFADAVQPETHTFDGVFIHSRGGAGAPIDGSSIAGDLSGPGQPIRTDLEVPVFMFETETDLTVLGYAAATQPDTSRIRTWEVPGTSHADAYIVGSFASHLGCAAPVNDGPQHVVVQAAFMAFSRWVADGTPPPSPGPISLASRRPVRLATDANGNVLGGVRTPAVDVPVSTLSGLPAPGASALCRLFGSTATFTPARLAELYGDRAGYLRRFSADLDRAIRSGYILPADRSGLIAAAREVRVG